MVGISNGFYQICFVDKKGSIKLRESRLFKSKEEALKTDSLRFNQEKKNNVRTNTVLNKEGFRSPYDYQYH